MKLPFYSVAVLAMCLLLACNRTSNRNDTDDITLNKIEAQESTVGTLDKPVTQFTPPQIVADEESVISTDSTAVAVPPPPNVLQTGGPANEDWNKKIIKTAHVMLELKDYKLFNTTIHNQLARYGAYIAGEQQTESDTQIQNVLTIKVTVSQFEALMNSIGGSDVKVLEKNISTEDVTGEVVDTKARIEAKKGVRDRYMELLKGAKTMKDILAVQEEINSIQEDLEAASGRVAYLSHNAAYSTIQLTYFQYLNGNSADTAEPTFFTKIKEAFATGSTILSNILLFFISVWPLVLAGAILVVYVKKSRLRKA